MNLINFENIEYLKKGNDTQRKAYAILTKHAILSKLTLFNPILVGTIPINIAIESSDLDVICCWVDKEEFTSTLKDCFGGEKDFTLFEAFIGNEESVVASFWVDGFDVEVFGQSVPTKQQLGYRHMLIEHQLLLERGEDFRLKIVELKRQGYKTEPAFGVLLGLKGNPYEALLAYELKGE